MPPTASLSKAERAAIKAVSDRRHDRYVQRTYGLAEGEYARMLDAQDGRCAMCRRRPRTKRLAVDHDHFTGKVRGLLCGVCNHTILGMLEFDALAAYHASIYIGQIAEDLAQQQLQPKPTVKPTRDPDDLPF